MKDNKKIDKESRDSYGRYHGYQEWFWNSYIWVRKKSRHGLNLGYYENHKDRRIVFYLR
jgi:hypothetical protein